MLALESHFALSTLIYKDPADLAHKDATSPEILGPS
jgi:hypothetical protein